MVVSEETCIVDTIDVVSMEMFVDNEKVVWKDRAVGKEFEDVAVDFIYPLRRLGLQDTFQNLND